MNGSSSRRISLFIGSYTKKETTGISVFQFDPETGTIDFISSADSIGNPSYLTVSEDGRRLYAVSETEEFEGQAGGGAASFTIDSSDGSLRFLNSVLSLGAAPCHISLDRTGSYALAANYSGGAVTLFPLQKDGSLGSASYLARHSGKGVNPERQEQPHPHSVWLDPDNRFVLVPDLGIDKIVIYQLDAEAGKLQKISEADANPGSGPRHLVFDASGRSVYVINELDSTISYYAYDTTHGKLAMQQTVSTLPDGYDGQSTCADIHLHPNGRFLYGSNRGHDSIAVFSVSDDGFLTPSGHFSTGGSNPRNFALSPDGRFLIAANQDSDSLVTFTVDAANGSLNQTGEPVTVSMPVCVTFGTGRIPPQVG